MTKHAKAHGQKWDMMSKIGEQICRYYKNDERPARSRAMRIDGPMLGLALRHAKRAWLFPSAYSWRGAPVTTGTVSDLVSAAALDACEAYVDFQIRDEEISDERFCLWRLSGSNLRVEFLSPAYPKLQRLRCDEVENNKIARATMRPRLLAKTLASRRDIL